MPGIPGGLDLIPAPSAEQPLIPAVNPDSSTKITIIDELNKDVPVLGGDDSGPVFRFPGDSDASSSETVKSGNADTLSLSPVNNDFVPSTPIIVNSPVGATINVPSTSAPVIILEPVSTCDVLSFTFL